MTTINTLKQQASDLGLTREYVSTFGKLSAKATWQSAIDAHLSTATVSTPQPTNTEPTTIADPWLSEPASECPTAEPSNVEHYSYQLCLPPAVEPTITSPVETTTPTPSFAVVLIVAVVVFVGLVIAVVKPLANYTYQLIHTAITHRRNEHRSRQQWYSELRQLMTT